MAGLLGESIASLPTTLYISLVSDMCVNNLYRRCSYTTEAEDYEKCRWSTSEMIQKIATGDYMAFGMFLLQDDNGEEVTVIKRDHIHDGAESVTQAILVKWLTSGAAPTRTYQHLIECLRQSELGALADSVAEMAGMPTYMCQTVFILVQTSKSIAQSMTFSKFIV